MSVAVKVIPRLYLGTYLEHFEDDYSIKANLFDDDFYNERIEGINFGASAWYEKERWFLMATIAPFGRSKLKNRRPNTVGKPNDVTKPVLWSITMGYLAMPKIHLNLLFSFFSREYRDDIANYYRNRSPAIGIAFKFNL